VLQIDFTQSLGSWDGVVAEPRAPFEQLHFFKQSCEVAGSSASASVGTMASEREATKAAISRRIVDLYAGS
jgi:hypothetical protein